MEQFKNIILGKSFISLRLIDWLLTHFTKIIIYKYWIDDNNKKIFKTLPDNIKKAASLRKFNMYIDYRAQLKSFSKMYLILLEDMNVLIIEFQIKKLLKLLLDNSICLDGFLKNYIYEYIITNYTEISKNMSSKNKNDKKTIEPIQKEIRYIKFY